MTLAATSMWMSVMLALAAEPLACQIPLSFSLNDQLATQALTRDALGAYFAGGATSGFRTTPGTYQSQHTPKVCQVLNTLPRPCVTGFVGKFSQSGEMVWGTYLGAPADEGDYVTGVAVAPDGTVWVDGYAASQNFPITPDAYQSTYSPHFLAALSADGSRLLYSSFLDSSFVMGLKCVQERRSVLCRQRRDKVQRRNEDSHL